jgi:enoyl-CoA hydratase
MSFENITFETEVEGIGVITVNRPKVLNALNEQTVSELRKAFHKAKYDPQMRVVILTGAGEKAFVAGADINEIQKLGFASGKAFSERGQALLDFIEGLGKPVICAINGFALGGGCELAMACHIRVAADTARLGQPEVSLGIIPGFGGTQRLARHAGRARACELVLTGEMISAEEAFRVGLVNRVVPQAQLMDEARKIAKSILSKSPLAVHLALQSIQRGIEVPLAEGLKIESELFGHACASEDKQEGTTAFLQKRKPVFKGK